MPPAPIGERVSSLSPAESDILVSQVSLLDPEAVSA